MPYYPTTARARYYTDGLGQIEPISAIVGGVTQIGSSIYQIVQGKKIEKDRQKAEKKAAKLIADATSRREDLDRKLQEELSAQQVALALAEQQKEVTLAQISDATSVRRQATLSGMVGPAMVLGILAAGLWFAFRGRG